MKVLKYVPAAILFAIAYYGFTQACFAPPGDSSGKWFGFGVLNVIAGIALAVAAEAFAEAIQKRRDRQSAERRELDILRAANRDLTQQIAQAKTTQQGATV